MSKLDFTAAIPATSVVKYMGSLRGLLINATQRIYDSHMERAQMRLAPVWPVHNRTGRRN